MSFRTTFHLYFFSVSFKGWLFNALMSLFTVQFSLLQRYYKTVVHEVSDGFVFL